MSIEADTDSPRSQAPQAPASVSTAVLTQVMTQSPPPSSIQRGLAVSSHSSSPVQVPSPWSVYSP